MKSRTQILRNRPATIVASLVATLLFAGAIPATAYIPPLPDPTIVRPFEPPETTWGPGHRGVDLSGQTGTEVLAPADGVVAFSGTVVDRGVVVINHPDGLRSTLEPVSTDISVGQHVLRGEAVARLETAGGHCLPATCLHWGVRRGDEYIDPWLLIDPAPRPIRLLPLCTDCATP